MDVAICAYDTEKEQLHFAGANRPLWIHRGNEIIVYSRDRQHIGFTSSPRAFTHHIIDIEQGDTAYIFSDGISDQFGGELGRRFTSKKIKNVLSKSSNLKLKQRVLRLEAEFLAWKEDSSQTDDVCMLAVNFDNQKNHDKGHTT
jgi:serine phosphatase RsbU (regulator of sigma subunit)